MAAAVPGEGLEGALRVARAIREIKRVVRNETRETIEAKMQRWRLLQAPELPPELQAVVPWDPAWPALFAAEAERLRAGLGAELVADVQHIGSTSVPHLAAKRVIDLLVAVRAEPPLDGRRTAALAGLGYDSYGTSPCDPEAHWFWRTGAPRCAFVVHLCAASNPWIATAVDFRDYLCAHPGECARYEGLKRSLAAGGERSLLEYSLIKLKLFYEISARAAAWRGARIPSPT